MTALPQGLITPYCTYAVLHFYMSLHVKNFMGASRKFEFFLILFTFVGMLFQYGFLAWFGWTSSWKGAGLLLLLGFLAFLVVMPLEVVLRKHLYRDLPSFLSLFGIVVIPLCAFLILRAT